MAPPRKLPGELRFGPLSGAAAHLCIDMQNVFAEATPWHTPWLKRVLPVVVGIAERHTERTIFTRFIPPERPGEMPGSWRHYYERWPEMTRSRIDRELLELVPALARLSPPAVVVDKRVYSPFVERSMLHLLCQRGVDTLVITGAETDVCVLAAVLGAVDFGYRVIVVVDAVCSSDDETHEALMTLYRRRFSQQVEIVDSEALLAHWK